MRVVFVTHNRLGLACLEELVSAGADVEAVFTRPERDDISDQIDLAGFAERESVELHRVDSLNDVSTRERIASYDPEVLFVIGWSTLVDQAVIEIPSVAALGMHPAPLPRGRGRAPIAWSLIKGLEETALSFFHLAPEADAGDLVGQEPIPIERDDDASSLYRRVVDAGRRLIRRHYPAFEEGSVPRTPQDESRATWWPKREPKDGLVDWTCEPNAIYDWIRGQTHPYPGAYTYLDDQRVTLWSANPPTGGPRFVVPGEIVSFDEPVLEIGAWEGTVELTRIGVSGREVPASALVTEYEYDVGQAFEAASDGGW